MNMPLACMIHARNFSTCDLLADWPCSIAPCSLWRLHTLQVITSNPARLIAILQLTNNSLTASVKHGLDAMLPVLVNYLPQAWKLMTDTIISCQKLLSSCKACQSDAECRPSESQAVRATSSSSSHTGPAVVAVLRTVLEGVVTAWRCYQALVEQRCEQRRLYMLSLDRHDTEQAALLLSPGPCQGSPPLPPPPGPGSRRSASAAGGDRWSQAELQREMKWMVHLLQIGKQLSSESSFDSPTNCSGCAATAVRNEKMVLVWKAAVEGLVKVTPAPLPKVWLGMRHWPRAARLQRCRWQTLSWCSRQHTTPAMCTTYTTCHLCTLYSGSTPTPGYLQASSCFCHSGAAGGPRSSL